MKNALESARKSLSINKDGLKALEAALEEGPLAEALGEAAARILAMKGRLIVTGLGKSGHIGAKLAATFASTGTPAFFVHPAEASHGDLGMIRREDVVLMLSWSGETRELSDIAAYTRRFAIPLIVMTGRADSRLAKSADITLALPRVREACPMNLAPTTSTMLQLVLGDALAIALLEARDFDETAFRDFHPGGKLGASLTALREIMVTGDDLPLVAPDAPVIAVIGALSRGNYGITGITGADGRLAGVITDGDIRRYLEARADASMRDTLHETRAESIMTRDPVSLEPGWLAAKALNVMQKKKISAAFVLDQEGRPEGLITMLHLLRAGVA